MMQLAPWRMAQPLMQPLNRAYQTMDELANQFFGNWPMPFSPQDMTQRFGVDVEEKCDSVVVRAEAAGYDPEDFDVQVHGDTLVIRAEHHQGSPDRPDTIYSNRRFYRSVTLPRGTQTENVMARYRNGVLEITLHKNPEQQGKRVHVTAG